MINAKFKKIFYLALLFLFLIMIGIQFIPVSNEKTNPPITGEPTWNSPQTRSIFVKACADCHSNETSWPWYSNIAPASWIVSNDVRTGRKHFNVSEWDRSQRGGEKVIKEVQRGAMPIGLYLLMHPESNLQPDEKKKFLEGLRATFEMENIQSSDSK